MSIVTILTVIPELSIGEFNSLLPFVQSEKRERITRLRNYSDKRNTLLGEILARVEICSSFNTVNSQIEISNNAHGKPYVSGVPSAHFNTSHTKCYIACAVADEVIGIDIESIEHVDLCIANRFFTPDEQEYINEKEHQNRLIEVWTMKESRMKMDGKCSTSLLSSFSVFDPSTRNDVFYQKVFQNSVVICSICSTKRDAPVVKLIGTTSLLKKVRILAEQNDYLESTTGRGFCGF